MRHVLGLQEGLQLGIGRENERFNQRHHFSFELIQLFHRERSLLGLLGPGERTIERALLGGWLDLVLALLDEGGDGRRGMGDLDSNTLTEAFYHLVNLRREGLDTFDEALEVGLGAKGMEGGELREHDVRPKHM